jgi:hypothetical protein
MPSTRVPLASASRALTSRKRTAFPSAIFARFALMRARVGITAGLSLRGKRATRTIVAAGAFFRHVSTTAWRPRVTSLTLASSPGSWPTLLVPARSTMTFGWTPSSSPFSRRQRMFSVRSPPHPKLAAFQPWKVFFQWARKSG